MNSLHVVRIYDYEGTYVFDDPSIDVVREPFVMGMPEIIDFKLAGRPIRSLNAVFSAAPFPGNSTILRRSRPEFDGHWYRLDGTLLEGWLGRASLRYFGVAPERLYIQCVAVSYAAHEDDLWSMVPPKVVYA